MGYSNPDALGDIQAAISAGVALGDPRTPVTPGTEGGSGVYAVVPNGYKIVSLEEFLSEPLRVRQHVELEDAESFVAYVNGYWNSDHSRIFFGQQKFVAILDYHTGPEAGGNVKPDCCQHVATFTPRQSSEFAAWMAMNRQPMDQVQFARFVEENQPDIIEPVGATLLEMALTFEAKKDVEFASGSRLQNGQIQFKYNEVVRGTAQSGTIEIPDQFILGIPVHLNGPNYRIEVRLRWRLKEGKAVFWYEVVRPQRFIDAALKEIRERIEKDTTRKVLAGIVNVEQQ